jgi:hypothetical protein
VVVEEAQSRWQVEGQSETPAAIASSSLVERIVVAVAIAQPSCAFA